MERAVGRCRSTLSCLKRSRRHVESAFANRLRLYSPPEIRASRSVTHRQLHSKRCREKVILVPYAAVSDETESSLPPPIAAGPRALRSVRLRHKALEIIKFSLPVLLVPLGDPVRAASSGFGHAWAWNTECGCCTVHTLSPSPRSRAASHRL